MTGLLSINDAAARGVERLRMPQWVLPMDHLKIDIVVGIPGPWVHLYSPANIMINERDPVDVLCIHIDFAAKVYVPYAGPLPGSSEYTDAVRKFAEGRVPIPKETK